VAQATPPRPPLNGAPPASVAAPAAQADAESSLRYEEAVRADALGNLDQARRRAEQGLALSPNGSYAASLKRLLDQIDGEQHLRLTAPHFAARSSPAASRFGFVFSGALAGLVEGVLAAGVAQASGSGVAGGGLAGFALGLAITLATMSEVSDPAVSSHLTLGWLYGVLAGLALAGIANGGGSSVALAGAIGLPVGACGGILVGTYADVTEGDAASGTTLFIHLVVVSALFATAMDSNLSAQAGLGIPLVGGTLGLLAGELLNRDLAWSDLRWGLISGSGALGALVGALVIAAANSGNAGAAIGVGDLLGLGIGMVATQGLSNEAPRGYQPSAAVPTIGLNALPPTQAPVERPARAFGMRIEAFRF
jgi:hypothetical protein